MVGITTQLRMTRRRTGHQKRSYLGSFSGMSMTRSSPLWRKEREDKKLNLNVYTVDGICYATQHNTGCVK